MLRAEDMWVDELLWMVVVHPTTVHPSKSSKQAKVTSRQLGLHPVVGCLRSVAEGAAGG